VHLVLTFSKWLPFQNGRQYKNQKKSLKKDETISMEMDIYREQDMLHHMATILICYGGHFESQMAAKIQKS
jgi:hypothetical protein